VKITKIIIIIECNACDDLQMDSFSSVIITDDRYA